VAAMEEGGGGRKRRGDPVVFLLMVGTFVDVTMPVCLLLYIYFSCQSFF
jgi:hypothetical protein